ASSQIPSSTPRSSKSNQRMFVSTGSLNPPPNAIHFSAKAFANAFAWHSFPPKNTSSTPTRAMAVSTPACRIPPPIALRICLTFAIVRSSPAMQLPTGAPRDLEKQTDTESTCFAYSPNNSTDGSESEHAFHNLAPSRCTFTPSPLAHSPILRTSSTGMTTPLMVFSSEITRVGAKCISLLKIACFCTSSNVRYFPFDGATGTVTACERPATPPASKSWMCEWESRSML
ncbi:hypothetical protein HOY82DRAFT_485202, partial [Tuber indicum]